jgi:hypothetical protein
LEKIMQNSRFLCCVAAILMISMPVLAQRTGKTGGTPTTTSTSTTSDSNDPGNNGSNGANNETGNGAGRREPCWKVAGIAPSVLQQRRSLEQNAKSQIAAVCADSSLSAQQRAAQIKAIHQQTEQALQALLTPQQEEALKACRAAREGGKENPHPEPPKTQATGPCGEPASTSTETPSPHKFN